MKLLLVLALLGTALAAPEEDLISSLPLLNTEFTSTHYSGYLNAGDGRNHFYWFTESQRDPANDPLILWLNGGPGCSSLLGAFTELGPYAMSSDGTELIENPYAWNTIANVIFMESPACVGFSYREDGTGSCAISDSEVALANYNAVKNFFEKFPEYASNDFYITGESYAGIYVPTLSVRVIEGQADFPINFQGYGIGNGLLSYQNNDDSLAFYANYHALVDPETWTQAVANCCVDGVESEGNCDFSSNDISTSCQFAASEIFNTVYSAGINAYNVIADCAGVGVASGKTQYQADLENLFRNSASSSKAARSDPPCLSYTYLTEYLNDYTVREAFHVSSEAGVWGSCDTTVGLLYSREYENVRPQLQFLVENVRGFIYNGDCDMAVNVLGNEWDLALMNLTLLEGTSKWTTNGQVAGYVTKYENLDFVTIRGSGHMVPEDKPVEALQMINAFLTNTDY